MTTTAARMPRTPARLSLKLPRPKESWFRRITPAFAKENPQYKPFVGLYLVTEHIEGDRGDFLEAGSVVPRMSIYTMQLSHGPDCAPPRQLSLPLSSVM
jgi:hypothetical protein